MGVAAEGDGTGMSDLENLRWQMVERQIAGRGIRSERVLEAMRAVPREAFVPAELRDQLR